MGWIAQKLTVLPEIYKGKFADIDQENNRAYQKYPFPWPHEKQYEHYTQEDVLKNLDDKQEALRAFIGEFGLEWPFIKDKVIVDLGAGVGWDALCLARNGAKTVYAVDNSETSLKHGERFARMLGIRNVCFRRSSLYDIGGLGLEADVIIAKGVLHHVFDLPRLADAMRLISNSRTQLLLTHSSYGSRLGFVKYLYNHLAWVFGGADLERRIDVGLRLFRGWHGQLTDKLARYRANDLAGVFYMARSPGRIMNIFRGKGFRIQKVPGRCFSDLYPRLLEHHCRMREVDSHKIFRKARRSAAMGLIESFRFLSLHFSFMDRALGKMYTFFFLMPAHTFFAQGMTSSQIFNAVDGVQGVRELAPEDTAVGY